ncbi:MAG: GatB/YqeY domain-containing protein [Bdellovibrionaceae bacterium]|nr:GatB/YqeY domain-containing protein [Pseudobdellovibrionaceae bacterium]
MSLKEKILEELSASMKQRDKAKVKILRFINSAIKNKEIEIRPKDLTDEHVISVLKKQIKQINESLEHYKKAGYSDQVKEEEFQISVLKSYLPEGLSSEELKKVVIEVIAETKANSIKDMGVVMKTVMAKTKGLAEGKILSQMVREELSNL